MNTAVALPISAELRASLGRVGVLYGGLSSERDISLQSGEAVLRALQTAGVDCVGIDVGEQVIDDIRSARIDRAFIILHGPGGEDGRIQALLEFMGIPYTGSGVQASAVAMDKIRTKYLWGGLSANSAIALPTPEFAVVSTASPLADVLGALGGSVMVKPANEGSSIGMSKVSSLAELEIAVDKASQFQGNVLVERVITGGEYTVAILDGEALPPIRMKTHHTFYDFDAKYLAEDTQYYCPCGLPDAKEAELKRLALDAFNALGCRGWGRVDVMADEAGNFYLLEVNTAPGMTSHSLVPMAAKTAGISFEQLVVTILLTTLSVSA